jgi:hypothetical protein
VWVSQNVARIHSTHISDSPCLNMFHTAPVDNIVSMCGLSINVENAIVLLDVYEHNIGDILDNIQPWPN